MKKYILPVARLLVLWLGFNEKKHLKRSFSRLQGSTGLTLIDVGAAGGIEKRWQAITGDLIYYGFEPDERSFKKLSSNNNARSTAIFPFALWSEEKKISVLLCRDPQCSSVYEPNRLFLDKFPIPERFDVIDTFSCNAKCLDQVQIQSPDFIKMDIQGAEFEVLKGAQNTLKETLGMEIEVEMLEMYKGQALFGEITHYLKQFDLEFVDFVGTRRWLRHQHSELGQFIFADALFLKPPEVVSSGDFSIEYKMNYLKILLIYRRFDLIYKFNEISSEIETQSFEGFLTAIKPIRRNFDRVNKLNTLISIIFRFFGVNYKSHIIY